MVSLVIFVVSYLVVLNEDNFKIGGFGILGRITMLLSGVQIAIFLIGEEAGITNDMWKRKVLLALLLIAWFFLDYCVFRKIFRD